jgi:hypothetical protein
LEGAADHNEPLTSREGIVDVVAVLGAADDYHEFINFFQNIFYGFEVP